VLIDRVSDGGDERRGAVRLGDVRDEAALIASSASATLAYAVDRDRGDGAPLGWQAANGFEQIVAIGAGQPDIADEHVRGRRSGVASAASASIALPAPIVVPPAS
jgi:hypothetical protein